jgi:hypothetical protein
MAFNYSTTWVSFLKTKGNCSLMITSTILFVLLRLPSSRHHRQLKKRYIFVETVFSFYSFWHIRKWKMIRHLSTWNWSWHIDGERQRLMKRTHLSKRAVLLMSPCRVAFCRERKKRARGSLLRNDQFNKTFHSLSLWSGHEWLVHVIFYRTFVGLRLIVMALRNSVTAKYSLQSIAQLINFNWQCHSASPLSLHLV